jgi:isocitrate/isopropylmalate dehydrogenase
MILSTALFFRHAGWDVEAGLTTHLVAEVLSEGAGTRDIGGTSTCRQLQEMLQVRLISSCA